MADAARPVDDAEDRDPGLARERTDLAWTRTAVSYAALGALMLRFSAVGLLVIVTAVVVWSLGQLSARRGWLSARRTAQILTAATTTMVAIALILAVVAPG